MCELSTCQILKWYQDYAHGLDRYSPEEHEKLHDAIEDVREEWLDKVFDVDAKLEALEWIKRVEEKGKWIFNPSELR